MVDQQAPDEIGSDRPPVRRRELCDVLAIGVLAAVTFRIVASWCKGPFESGPTFRRSRRRARRTSPTSSGGSRSSAMAMGSCWPAGALGLVWWQVYSVPRTLSPEASDHSTRSLWLCKWMTAVFAVTAVGSLAYAIADWISYWDEPRAMDADCVRQLLRQLLRARVARCVRNPAAVLEGATPAS